MNSDTARHLLSLNYVGTTSPKNGRAQRSNHKSRNQGLLCTCLETHYLYNLKRVTPHL